MQIIFVYLLVVYLLLVYLGDCYCQYGFCNAAREHYQVKQALAICTDQFSTSSSVVLIDTYKVSKSQEINCECYITPFGFDVEIDFEFYNSQSASGMSFEINNIFLNATVNRGGTFLIDITPLRMSTSSDFTNGGVCLIVTTDKTSRIPFNITCASVETNSSITTTQGQIGNKNIIIPATIASLGAVCLLTAIPLIIFCRRKYTKKSLLSVTSTLPGRHGEQRDHHDADNPVFDVTETQSRVSSTAHDYNYIDNYHFGGNQYNTLSEQHYDCAINQNNKSNMCRKGKIGLGDTMYNTTSGNVGQGQEEADDYHHLGMSNSKKAIVDEYNTVDIANNVH